MSEAQVQIGPAEPVVAGHFETDEQQSEAGVLGMWLFLAQEVMFFGGLFTAYAVYRFRYPDVWAEGSSHLNTIIGAGNTMVLLTSSLTMALAFFYCRTGNLKRLVYCLSGTLVLGTVFLVVKYFEYREKYIHGLMPGIAWHPHAAALDDPSQLQLFFVLYFTMTGMHALHMIIGIGIGLVLLGMVLARKFGPNRYMPIEFFGFYWHFVDIVWVFLFPLLYLIPPLK